MPDADLLAAVTEEIGLDPEDPKDIEVGALAARAAGRVLAERLRAKAKDIADAMGFAPDPGGFASGHVIGTNNAGALVARWCGTEPEEERGER